MRPNLPPAEWVSDGIIVLRENDNFSEGKIEEGNILIICHPRTGRSEGDIFPTSLNITLSNGNFSHRWFETGILCQSDSQNTILKFGFDGAFIGIGGQGQDALK